MKIVATSNYNDETFSEYTVIPEVSKLWAEYLARAMNRRCPGGYVYYQAKEDDYELYRWEP